LKNYRRRGADGCFCSRLCGSGNYYYSAVLGNSRDAHLKAVAVIVRAQAEGSSPRNLLKFNPVGMIAYTFACFLDSSAEREIVGEAALRLVQRRLASMA
jgi:hypothetical protein